MSTTIVISAAERVYLTSIVRGGFRMPKASRVENNPTLTALRDRGLLLLDTEAQKVRVTPDGLEALEHAADAARTRCRTCEGRGMVKTRGGMFRCSTCNGSGTDNF